LAFYPKDRIDETSVYFRMGFRVLNRIEKYRWKKRYFGLPLELRIVDALTRKFKGYI